MEATTATPDAPAPEDRPDTPPAEPVEPTTPEAAADQPTAEPERFGQAEYTRAQQTFSAIRQELGLDRRATREDVLEAVRQRAASEDTDDEADEELDPRIVEAHERAQAAEARVFASDLRTAAAIYGDDFTSDGLEVANILRTTDDPNEIMVALAGFRDKYAGAADEVDDDEDEADPNAVPAPVGLSEGDTGPSARQAIPASAARQESGPIQAIRGLFKDAGISSRDTAKN